MYGNLHNLLTSRSITLVYCDPYYYPQIQTFLKCAQIVGNAQNGSQKASQKAAKVIISVFAMAEPVLLLPKAGPVFSRIICAMNSKTVNIKMQKSRAKLWAIHLYINQTNLCTKGI